MSRPKSLNPSPAKAVLMLADPDSLKLLHRAFAGSRDCWASLAIRAKVTSDNAAKARDTREAARHAARVTEYQRRAAVVQAWIDELPSIEQE